MEKDYINHYELEIRSNTSLISLFRSLPLSVCLALLLLLPVPPSPFSVYITKITALFRGTMTFYYGTKIFLLPQCLNEIFYADAIGLFCVFSFFLLALCVFFCFVVCNSKSDCIDCYVMLGCIEVVGLI